MDDINSFLPLRLMRFPNQESSDTDFEGVLLAEVCGHDSGVCEIAFSIGRKRYYIGIRVSDLPMLAREPEA